MKLERNTAKLIDLTTVVEKPTARALMRTVQWPVEKLLAIDRVNRVYDDFRKALQAAGQQSCVFHAALDALKVRYRVDPADLERIPTSGPLVVVANHPFGGIDGIVIGALLQRRRSDVRILGNYLLKQIEGIREQIIAVDPFGYPKAKGVNRHGLKQTLAWLRKGGTLATFPSGEVASWQGAEGRVADPEWNPHTGALIRISQATTLPVYFPGRNSALFMLLGRVHPLLRTMLLPREMVNKRLRTLNVHIGQPIAWPQLARYSDDDAITNYLRFNTEILKDPSRRPTSKSSPTNVSARRQPGLTPVIAPKSGTLLAREVQKLPEDHCLIRRGEFGVYIVQSHQIPNLLNEIGRLREITFREVGEGTGRAIDLDRFDEYYLHLFLWNHATSELVGAYRLGRVDLILSEYGPKGLYTSELFRFKPEFIQQLTHAIEFGRSFIRSEYQKKYNSLILIWRGIGAFIARHPQYKILFGPVSISGDYHRVSKTLLVQFLKQNSFNKNLSGFVRPRRPFRCRRIDGLDQVALSSTFRDIDDISLLISEIEKDGKSVPILLKHYLKLNGKLLSFNLDKNFSSALDGLLMVDLRETDPRILKRFIGPKGADNLLNGNNIRREKKKPDPEAKDSTSSEEAPQ